MKSQDGVSPRLSADEVRGVIQAALAVIDGDLRMRTQQAASIDDAVSEALGDDLLRRLSLLDPSLDHAHPVEAVRAGAAASMRHARHHEELD